MNLGHVLQSLPMQQMMAGNPNWLPSSSSSLVFPHYLPPPSFPVHPWNDTQDLPESWSQLLLGGIVGEEDRSGPSQYHQDQVLYSTSSADVKQEVSESTGYAYSHGNEEFQSNWSHVMAAASSPKSSSVTSFSSNNNMLDFSNNKALDRRQSQQPEHSSECDSSTASGGAFKKARIQPSSTTTTFKVRKEKLGDRITALHQLVSPFGKVRKEKLGDKITALHQLVSPFGKTDTASVLLEAIGYIRFLQNQIEALSTPYLGNGSANMRQQQQSVQGEKNCIFPEDPGQLLNDNCLKRKGTPDQVSENEPRKDLKSRGLCLVPVSCTLQVGSDNGADYWAPTLGGGFR